MTISKKQIEDIQENVADSTPGAAEDIASPLNNLTPEVLNKLAAPLPEEPLLKYDSKDVILILEDLSQKTGVTFNIDETVRAIPQKDRSITVQAKAGMNAMTLLLEEVLRKIKKLDVVFQGDSLLFTTKGRSATPSPTTETPPATPGTPVTPAAPGAAPVVTPPPPPPAAAPAAAAALPADPAASAVGSPPPARRRGPR